MFPGTAACVGNLPLGLVWIEGEGKLKISVWLQER